MVQWLVFGELAGCEPARQVQRAELKGKAPVERIHFAGNHRAELPGLVINTEIYRAPRRRMLDRHGPGYAEWSEPRKAIGKVAEAFAEENAGND